MVDNYHLKSLDAYSKHKIIINNYMMYYGGNNRPSDASQENFKTDFDVVKENHQFLWDDEETDELKDWNKQLAKKYYDKLFKEFCICDLSCYVENKIAMRWRIEKEVISGKGQFICGDKKCNIKDDLVSWEVNFMYNEHNEVKNALVKLKLCPLCSLKLNYHKKHKKYEPKTTQFENQEDTLMNRNEINNDVIEEKTAIKLQKDSHCSDKWKTTNANTSNNKNPIINRDEEMDDFLNDLFK